MGGVCVLACHQIFRAPNPNGEAESLPSSRSKQFEDISGHSVPALHPSVYEHAARLADKRSQVSPHYLIMGQHGIFRTPGSAETRFPLSIRPETSLCLGPYIKADNVRAQLPQYQCQAMPLYSSDRPGSVTQNQDLRRNRHQRLREVVIRGTGGSEGFIHSTFTTSIAPPTTI